MQEDISTQEGVSQEEQQAPTGNPAESGENTGNGQEATPPADTPPVKTPSDFARERILKRELSKLQAQGSQDDEDDDVDPTESDLIKKVVEKNYGDRLNDLDTKLINEDIDKAIDKSPYKEFLQMKEQEQVRKYAFDPKYANLPIQDLIALSLSPRMVEIGAELSRRAEQKISDTTLPSTSSSSGAHNKNVAEMSDKEYAEYRRTLPGVQ